MQTEINQIDTEGNPHGFWVERHFNNEIMYSGNYVNGCLHGPWFGYHNDGSLWYKQTFDMDKKIGYFIHYNSNNILLSKKFYAR